MLSPLDDRYREQVAPLVDCFSGFAYTKQRVEVEIRYLRDLCNVIGCPINIPAGNLPITNTDYDEINKIDAVINHDVKAIEYFLRDYLKKHIPSFDKPHMIHFGLTSQDVNSIAFSLNFKKATCLVFEKLKELINNIQSLSALCDGVVMLSRTHGQPATPMKLSRYLGFFIKRMSTIMNSLKSSTSDITAKCGGAVGNLAAHKYVNPNIHWDNFMDRFVGSFGLVCSEYTIQIDSYDSITRVLSDLLRMLVIVKDYTENIWNYIKDGYFCQIVHHNETGSSVMPHKVNPINFENALGNISLAIGMLEAYIRDLPLSRYQRDLKDSTMLRSIGEVYGKIYLALSNVTKGTTKLYPNKQLIVKDLEDHAEIIMEPIQTYLRALGFNNAYEQAKEFSRGVGKLDLKTIREEFIKKLDIDETHKDKLLNLTPLNYLS